MAKKARADRDDEDDDDRDDAADDRPRSDAYVGLLIITLVAVLGGALLMFLDHGDLSAQTAQPPTVNVTGDLEYKQPAARQ